MLWRNIRWHVKTLMKNELLQSFPFWGGIGLGQRGDVEMSLCSRITPASSGILCNTGDQTWVSKKASTCCTITHTQQLGLIMEGKKIKPIFHQSILLTPNITAVSPLNPYKSKQPSFLIVKKWHQPNRSMKWPDFNRKLYSKY